MLGYIKNDGHRNQKMDDKKLWKKITCVEKNEGEIICAMQEKLCLICFDIKVKIDLI